MTWDRGEAELLIGRARGCEGQFAPSYLVARLSEMLLCARDEIDRLQGRNDALEAVCKAGGR
jgi:hypothetical protein